VKSLQVDCWELIEERKDWDAVHYGGFEEEALAAGGGEVAEFAVGVDDGSFVGGDGVGSMIEGGADVVDGGLAGFYVEGCGFEEDIGAGGGEPGANVGRVGAGRECSGQAGLGIETGVIGDPSQATSGDSGDAK
jgi:hypothetical protein